MPNTNWARKKHAAFCKWATKETLSSAHHFIRYKKDAEGNKVGVVVAKRLYGRIYAIGTSKCHTGEAFDRHIGLDKALRRSSMAELDIDNENAVAWLLKSEVNGQKLVPLSMRKTVMSLINFLRKRGATYQYCLPRSMWACGPSARRAD